jgi:hypothetical protein
MADVEAELAPALQVVADYKRWTLCKAQVAQVKD